MTPKPPHNDTPESDEIIRPVMAPDSVRPRLAVPPLAVPNMPKISGTANANATTIGGVSGGKPPFWKKPIISRLFVWACFAGYFLIMAIMSWFAVLGKDLPPMDQLWQRSRPVSVKFVDRAGRDLMVRGAKEAHPVSIDTLPPEMVHAVLAIEDRRFYHHVGIDLYSISRAIIKNLQKKSYGEGASTLTQQLVKNVFLTKEKTITRKTKEAILALWLERDFTKDEILEMYLDKVYFGAGSYGVDAASRSYFDKPVTEVNLTEAAMLAGVLKAPANYNPRASKENSGKRTARVLASMHDAGFITGQQRYDALTTPLEFHKSDRHHTGEYFVEWIWPQLLKHGGPPQEDLIVQTTLDRNMQEAAERHLSNYLSSKSAKSRNVTQGAIISLDAAGDVLAMVGGRDFGESNFNRAVQAKRQPGSAFKPFVYLSAYEMGRKPWDYEFDEPITIYVPNSEEGKEWWDPRNFNEKFNGEIKLNDALARSVNTVAAKLGQQVGMKNIVKRASDFGFEKLIPVPSLALGSQGVSPMELTQAYQAFASYGYQRPAFGITRVSGMHSDKIYYDHNSETDSSTQSRKVIDQYHLGLINRSLKNVVQTGSARAAKIKGFDVAGKTGTTNDYRDAWFVGFVPDLVTTIWVGNDDNSPMKKVTGGAVPTRIWKAYMSEVLEGVTPARLPIAQEPITANRVMVEALPVPLRSNGEPVYFNPTPVVQDPYLQAPNLQDPAVIQGNPIAPSGPLESGVQIPAPIIEPVIGPVVGDGLDDLLSSIESALP